MSVLASHNLRSEGVPGLRDWVYSGVYTTSENLRTSVRLICWNHRGLTNRLPYLEPEGATLCSLENQWLPS